MHSMLMLYSYAHTNETRWRIYGRCSPLDHGDLIRAKNFMTGRQIEVSVTIFLGSSGWELVSVLSTAWSSCVSASCFLVILAFLLTGLVVGASSSVSESAWPLLDFGLDFGLDAAGGAAGWVLVEADLILALALAGAGAPSVAVAFFRGGMFAFVRGKVSNFSSIYTKFVCYMRCGRAHGACSKLGYMIWYSRFYESMVRRYDLNNELYTVIHQKMFGQVVMSIHVLDGSTALT